jgi:acyl-CoA synthetase (AMP-forming)/AMP-acid ligase II
MAGDFTYADVYEAIAAVQPDHPAIVQGERIVTWGAFDGHADALAADFIAAGLTEQSKVAAYLYNGPEYLETYYAAFKGGFAPFNVNYRYGAEELLYLLDNADAEAVVFHAAFAPILDSLRARLPLVKRYMAVSEPGHPVPDWAADYDLVIAKSPNDRPVKGPWGRSGDHILMLYTGGTTGMPKGVMWRQDEVFCALGQGGNILTGEPPIEAVNEIPARLADPAHHRPVGMAASPLMHGTGQFGALSSLSLGGTVSLLPSRKFSAEELWGEVEGHGVTRIGIVGLAFSTPMLDALEANPGRWNLDHVRFIGSSGSMWSQENKTGLLKHIPGCVLSDAFSSSEALGMGASQSGAGSAAQTARFTLGPNAVVFTEDGRRVVPGSGEQGMVAVGGRLPEGYYKDPEKTAKTFPTFEGRRWCMPGDWATVNEDGTLNLLGRGSVCINTGGEKVFPEEVEEALKRHADVRDAVVVGLPDVRFGERICAVIELTAGAAEPSLAEIAAHIKTQLADYKAPRSLVVVDTVGRAPNGKVDYKGVKARAMSALGMPA